MPEHSAGIIIQSLADQADADGAHMQYIQQVIMCACSWVTTGLTECMECYGVSVVSVNTL